MTRKEFFAKRKFSSLFWRLRQKKRSPRKFQFYSSPRSLYLCDDHAKESNGTDCWSSYELSFAYRQWSSTTLDWSSLLSLIKRPSHPTRSPKISIARLWRKLLNIYIANSTTMILTLIFLFWSHNFESKWIWFIRPLSQWLKDFSPTEKTVADLIRY